jgi:hypothetical protein
MIQRPRWEWDSRPSLMWLDAPWSNPELRGHWPLWEVR